MKKISFKNPKGGTIYLAKVGFDWGAFWGMLSLAGLPFFLRKMNMFGWFCLIFILIQTLGVGLGQITLELNPEAVDLLRKGSGVAASFFLTLGLSLYLGIRGGKLTARHYVEEGYECITKDEVLLARARTKWDMEI